MMKPPEHERVANHLINQVVQRIANVRRIAGVEKQRSNP